MNKLTMMIITTILCYNTIVYGLDQVNTRDRWGIIRPKINAAILQNDASLAALTQLQIDHGNLAVIVSGLSSGGAPADYSTISALAVNAVPSSGASTTITSTDGSMSLVNGSGGITSGILGLYFQKTQVQGQLEVYADPTDQTYGVVNLSYLNRVYPSWKGDSQVVESAIEFSNAIAKLTGTALDNQLIIDFDSVSVIGEILILNVGATGASVPNLTHLTTTYYSKTHIDTTFVPLTTYNTKVASLEARLDALEAIVNSGAMQVDSITYNLGGWTQQGVAGGGIEQVSP